MQCLSMSTKITTNTKTAMMSTRISNIQEHVPGCQEGISADIYIVASEGCMQDGEVQAIENNIV